MLVYVVCASVAWDSYHSVVLATLDKAEAELSVAAVNNSHDEDCLAPVEGYTECVYIRRHLHELPLHGTAGKLDRGIQVGNGNNQVNVF